MSKIEQSSMGESMWVRRDEAGIILSVSRIASPDHPERVAGDSDDVVAFARALAPKQSALNESDLALIRVIEDLIDVLIHKDVLRFTDLPDRVQAKLLERRRLRGSMRSLDLLGEGQDTI